MVEKKQRKKAETPKKPKVLECYHCGGVLAEEDMVIKPMPLATKAGIRNYKRKFHINCMVEYMGARSDVVKMQVEEDWWDKCYLYAKELSGVKVGQNLSQHFVMRLRGLRVGKYYPAGNNVKGIKRGYDYETILMTMKFASGAIRKALGEMSFQNDSHRIDYMMKIVTTNVNFIAGKVDASRVMNAKLKLMEIETKEEDRADYIKKGSTDDNKVDQMVSEFKKQVEQEDDVMSLFN